MILFTLQSKPETRIVAGFNKRFFENLITHKTSPQAGSEYAGAAFVSG